MAGPSEFQRGRQAVLKEASKAVDALDERIARQWDTIDSIMAFLSATKQIDKFNKWAEGNRSSKHHDDWKRAHPDA